jgi:hypothetical protein
MTTHIHYNDWFALKLEFDEKAIAIARRIETIPPDYPIASTEIEPEGIDITFEHRSYDDRIWVRVPSEALNCDEDGVNKFVADTLAAKKAKRLAEEEEKRLAKIAEQAKRLRQRKEWYEELKKEFES